MPLTFDQQAQQVSNPQLIARTAAALVKSALSIMAEDAGTKGHTERTTWANAVLANPQTWGARAVWAVVSNPNAGSAGKDDPTGIAADNDSALEFILNSVWNAYANYSPAAAAPAAVPQVGNLRDLAAMVPPPIARPDPIERLRRFWRWLFFRI